MIKAQCLSCLSPIDIQAHPQLGQRVVCPQCETALEVIWLYPVTLDYPEVGGLILDTPKQLDEINNPA